MKNPKYIVILVGVCGTGKSNVGKKVANQLEIPFIDADKLPVADELPKGKLPQEIDLDNWMTSLKKLIVKELTKKGCVISCSVLKREHRKKLAADINHPIDWIFMKGSYEKAVDPRDQDVDHGRPAAALKWDFEHLEVPKRALTIEMSYSKEDMVDTILKYMARKYW